MRVFCLFFCFLFIVACSDTNSENSDKSVAKKVPLFVVDRIASGPLTLAELQINIPKKIGWMLTDNNISCILKAAESRAREAGDPELLDPDAFPYWGGSVNRDEWSQHSTHMQRVLLAQAIISWAMIDC